MIFRRWLVFAITFFASSVYAANQLEDIRFAELPNNNIEIRAVFSTPPAVPKGYVIEKPARVVLDLPDVQSRLPQKKYALGLNGLSSAVVLSAADRTRIILNLTAPSTYKSTVQGNVLVTTVSGATLGSNVQSSLRTSGATSSGVSITGIDFRRDEKGGGQLFFNLSNPTVAVNVERKADKVLMRFPDTGVAERLQRRLDVIDFATPVQFVETRQQNSDVVVSIEASGQYDYLAYQADDAYVLTVSPLTTAQIEENKSRFQFVGEKLSLNFQDIEVRKVLEIIADFTDLNLVASDTVGGNITLRLDNVPWDQALDLVLKSKGLDKRQSGNILMVAPASEIAERERQELESRKQLQELEPLTTEFIRIRYANATDILSLISSGDGAAGGNEGDTAEASGLNSVLSSRGSAVVDERTNSLVLTDIASSIEGIKVLIEKVDIPVRQVMIEARIVSASDTFRKELGVNFTGNELSVTNGTGSTGGSLNIAAPTTQAAVGTFGITYLSGDISLGLEITALENAGYAEVISQPKILTGDKQTAKIQDGQQIPFTSTSGDTTSTIFQDAVLSLEVTPQITPDNRIIMELQVNRDSLDGSTDTPSGSPINVTELTTTALVGDGDTIVLGGIFEQSKSTSERKVPILGDIPVFGRLFRSETNVDDRNELLIFITPRILTDEVLDK